MKRLIFITLIFAFGFMGYQFVHGFMDNLDLTFNSFSSIPNAGEFEDLFSNVQSIGAVATDDHTFRNILVSGWLFLMAMNL